MSFLPEDDQEFLLAKNLAFELATERLSNGTERRGIVLPTFRFAGNLYSSVNGENVLCSTCDLLIVIPPGYGTTKLDSFYTSPRLFRPGGAHPDRAAGEEALFGRKWQFWSRHLGECDWRAGIDGLSTYLQYVIAELRKA